MSRTILSCLRCPFPRFLGNQKDALQPARLLRPLLKETLMKLNEFGFIFNLHFGRLYVYIWWKSILCLSFVFTELKRNNTYIAPKLSRRIVCSLYVS